LNGKETTMNWAALIAAIAMVESGGDPQAVGDGGRAIGILQVRKILIEDVNRVADTWYRWPQDARDPAKSRRIARLYLDYYCGRYTARTGQAITPDVAARIWNGGPRGYAFSCTADYGRRVAALYEANRETRE